MTYWPGTEKSPRQLAEEAKIKGDAEWGIDDAGDLVSDQFELDPPLDSLPAAEVSISATGEAREGVATSPAE